MPKLTFIEKDGTRREVEAPLGLSVMEIAHRFDVDIEGACEGSLACATCHVIVDEAWYDKLHAPSEDEEDMLDLAFGLAPTRSEEHTSELQSLMRISYAVLCLKQKKNTTLNKLQTHQHRKHNYNYKPNHK